MKHQIISEEGVLNLFEEEITIVNTHKLMRLLPHLDLDVLAKEFIVKKHKNNIELIPFEIE